MTWTEGIQIAVITGLFVALAAWINGYWQHRTAKIQNEKQVPKAKKFSRPAAYIYSKNYNGNSNESKINVLLVANIIGDKMEHIEDQIGEPFEIRLLRKELVADINEGGEGRSYNYRGYLLDINYDLDNIATGIRIEGFARHNLKLQDYYNIIVMFGLSSVPMPDYMPPNFDNPTSFIWTNWSGYHISLANTYKINAVDIVHIYKIPKKN